MLILLISISVIYVALGAAMVLYTSQTKSFLREFVLGMNMRLWSFAALLFGILFIVGAFVVEKVFWIALVLGLLAVTKGLYLGFGQLAQIRSLTEWWFDRASETVIRLWGLLAYTLGVVLLSWLL